MLVGMDAPALDLIEDAVVIAGRRLSLLRPRDSEVLLDEEKFAVDEFMPYWAELWPSGVALAEAVGRRPVRGKRVLELGCGLALPSLAAALGGARVLATDWSPDAVSLAARNARRNGLELETAVVPWASAHTLAARGPWDVVLAADVLYEPRNADQLLALLPRLVGPTGEVVVADPGRPPAAAFLERAAPAWRIETVAVSAKPRVSLHSLAWAQ